MTGAGPERANAAPLGHSAAARNARILRREQVAVMLASRATAREMAEALSVSVSTVHNDVEMVRRGWREAMAQSYDAHVAEQFGIIDALLGSLMPKAMAADETAVSGVVRLLRERARLLGLDKPVKVQARVDVVQWESETDQAIRELLGQAIRELLGQMPEGPPVIDVPALEPGPNGAGS